MPIHHRVFSALLAFLALANAASASTEACLPTNERENGMNINFYEYALGDKSTYTDSAYMAYGYANTKKVGSVSGQTALSIYYDIPCDSTPTCSDDDSTPTNEVALMKRYDENCSSGNVPMKRDTADCNPDAAYWSSDLFGFYTTPTNVTVEMTGYFLPPENGSYTFTFPRVDDSAILSVGGDAAFGCCEQQRSPVTSTDFTVDGVGKQDEYVEGSVYMYAGYYYPMKIVFSNANSSATLPILMTLPNGTTIYDDYEGFVYSFDNNLAQANCTITDPARHTLAAIARTRTAPWTGAYTTTLTQTSFYTGVNGLTTYETIYEIETPTSVLSSNSPSTHRSTEPTTSSEYLTTSATTSTETRVVSSLASSTNLTTSAATSSQTETTSTATSSEV
ncbi:uncharacterized protein DI49_1606, partial [Saccharomyces eubayanus]|uniref:uncharacterized protein n=1 Tax=Saccharomyces eubayanus TaxID=1080349 RepID=UPI0006BFF793